MIYDRKEYMKKYREANKEYFKVYRLANKDKIKSRMKLYRLANKDNLNLQRKEYDKLYRLANKEKINLYCINRRKNDINFRVLNNLRIRIYQAIKGINKTYSTMKLLSCGIDELKQHLEKQFTLGMNWKNYGYGWHVDHIRPCSSYDLTKEEEQRACFHKSNLQPLWAIENIKKSNKIID